MDEKLESLRKDLQSHVPDWAFLIAQKTDRRPSYVAKSLTINRGNVSEETLQSFITEAKKLLHDTGETLIKKSQQY